MSSHGDRFRSRTGLFPQGFKFPGFQGLCMGGLDGTSYLPTGGPVMVLTSTCTDAVPHNPGQVTFARQKDGSSPFPSFPPVRPLFGQGDPYSTLQSPLLSLHHPLLASHTLGRSYLGGYRPLGLGVGEGFHGSAFVPAKGSKLDGDQPLLMPPCYPGGDGVGFRGLTQGKEAEDQSDSGAERMSETPNMSEESRSVERSSPEDGGTPKRRQSYLLDGQTPFCPICGTVLQLSELSAHFETEVERLLEMSKCIGQQLEGTPLHPSYASPICMVRKDDKGKPESRWETYQRIKVNRTTRLTSRCVVKKKRWDDPSSPICQDRPGEEGVHLSGPLRKRSSMDVEGEATADSRASAEFNWAVTARLHAIAQLQRGLSEYSARKFEVPDDENQELNVDGDDSATYGQPHYTEADVISCSTEDGSDNKEKIRRLHSSESNYPRRSEASPWNVNGGQSNGEGQEVTSTCVSNTDAGGEFSTLEKASKGALEGEKEPGKEALEGGIKCLICMEPFMKPVVSICCWHVHCEECWLKTLGAKKLCPQCNMITSPRDLRRIYL